MENIRNVKLTYNHSWIPDDIRNINRHTTIDEYMVYSCSDAPACYTAGRDMQLDSNTINGLPVYTVSRAGELSYHGPGSLALVLFLNPRKILDSNVHVIIATIQKSIIDYVQEQHNILLYFDQTDPGFYDTNNNKIISIDCDVTMTRPMVYYITINVLIPDFKYIHDVSICGVQNRPVANLLKTGTWISNESMDQIAIKLLQDYIWKNLYPEFDNVVPI